MNSDTLKTYMVIHTTEGDTCRYGRKIQGYNATEAIRHWAREFDDKEIRTPLYIVEVPKYDNGIVTAMKVDVVKTGRTFSVRG